MISFDTHMTISQYCFSSFRPRSNSVVQQHGTFCSSGTCYYRHSNYASLSNSVSKSNSKIDYFQYCVTRWSPSFNCCVTFSVANYPHGQVEITGAMSSFTMMGICAYHVYQRTWMSLLGKNTIARKSSNEHDPYAVAVVENVGERSSR